jgi:predicted DsbA family dithiol-disulfide isomerase
MSESAVNYSDVNDNGLLDLDVYFDFLCPFAYQASRWVMEVSELMGADVISVRWKFFSLEQNSKKNDHPDWKIWEQSPETSKGLLAFLAGSAAHKAGGEAALGKFYLELGKLRHEQGKAIWEKEVVEEAWEAAGLDKSGLAGVFDGSDKSGYSKLETDHTEAVEKYNAFGTPTLVFEEHRSFFLKLMPRPAELDEALELFQHVQRMAMGFKGGAIEFQQTLTKERQQEIAQMTEMSRKGMF